ncbi:hypothetical protein AB1Y20_022839 [Prymnesium parvum]|uniref:Uncharacterized protein n=1 Tax=Prymnesium parvum TaxID=97485 RepID=A0AB34JDV4_PRYPA
MGRERRKFAAPPINGMEPFFPRKPLQPLPIALGPTFATAQGGTPRVPIGPAFWAPCFPPVASPLLPTSCIGLPFRAHAAQLTPVQMPALDAVPSENEGKKKQKTAQGASRPTGNKKGVKERQYDVDDLRKMAAQVISGEMPSARAAALAAGLPHANRSLDRYLRRVCENASLQCELPANTTAARLQHVSRLEFEDKGNPDFYDRRLFSDDELDTFARALKLYADMGWPMDMQQIRHMFSQAAAQRKLQNWCSGSLLKHLLCSV